MRPLRSVHRFRACRNADPRRWFAIIPARGRGRRAAPASRNMSEHAELKPVSGRPTRGTPPTESVLRPLWLAAAFGIFLYLGWSLLAGVFQPRADWFVAGRWRAELLVYYATLDGFALALSAAFLCGLDGRNFRLLGLGLDPGWFRHAAAGLAWGMAVISSSVLLLAATRSAGVNVLASRALSRIVFLAAFLLLSALFEELAFRGYALVRAADAVGPVVACLVSSAIFGLAHFANPHATFFSTLNTALAGVLLAIARLRSRALWMPIALHFAWNFSLGPLFSFPVSGLTFGADQLSTPAPGPVWLSGGAYGPEGSVALTAALAVAIPLLLRFPMGSNPFPPS